MNKILIISKISSDYSNIGNIYIDKIKGVSLDYGENINKVPYLKMVLFMDYMPSDLKRFAESNEGKDCSFEIKKKHLLEICDSLEYFKSEQIVHGDLKPENVLINK